MARFAFFADGTWNSMDRNGGTNVVKLYNATRETPSQKRGYDEGVGSSQWDKLRGGLFGMGISQNIKDGYTFLLEKGWKPGDEIFLFGFSRGAYTVRSLAGWLNFVGLIGTNDKKAIDQAYDLYRAKKDIVAGDAKKKQRYEAFQRDYVPPERRQAKVRLLGVWDTVGALGIPQSFINEHLNPFQHGFHDTTLGANVVHAVHAVAIDEKRKSFEPTLWPDDDPRVTQVYFTGVHSDVGGGYNEKPEDRILGDVTLRFMADQAVKDGLELDDAKLPKPDDAWYCGTQHESYKGKWTIVRRFDREIPDGCTLHRTVYRRLSEADKKKLAQHPYAPPRLTRPWERFKIFD